MASRSDVQIFWNLSPRLIFVDDPSVEMTIQDLHDTLRDREQEPINLVYPTLISSAGKEDLGGGVSVGITSTLQNARIGFQARKVWVTDGYVTETNTDGRVLIDGYATFITSGVEPGAWIVNTSDGSICTALTIDSETQITTDYLGGGDTNEFTWGHTYRIMNVTQVEVDGGNLVAVDGYGLAIDPIFPTAGTQAVRTASSALTTLNQESLTHSTFNGHVTVDVVNGVSGILFPTGTDRQPSNNISDARAIALLRGFSILKIIGDITLGAGDNVSDFTIIGENSTRTTITVLSSSSTANVIIEDATVTGEFDTISEFNNCHLVDISFVESNIHNCVLEGTIVLGGAGSTSIYNSSDGLVIGAPPPSIDFNGSGRSLAIRNYTGDLELKNKTGSEGVEINMNSGGQVVLDSTVTNGTIRMTGIIDVIDNSTGSTIVDTSHVIFPDQLQLAAFNGAVHISPDTGSTGTKFPLGTEQDPVNNLLDAFSIADARGLREFKVDGYLVVSNGDVLDGYRVSGVNQRTADVYLSQGCSTSRTSFFNLNMSGYVDGSILIENCSVSGLIDLGSDSYPTIIYNTQLNLATYKLRSDLGTPQDVHFLGCWSGVPGDGYVTLDFNHSTVPIGIRGYHGGIFVDNYSGGHISTMGFAEGKVIFNTSCTSGAARVDGIVEVVDVSGPGFLVTSRSHLHRSIVARDVWDELLTDHLDTSTFGGWIGSKLLTVSKFLALK